MKKQELKSSDQKCRLHLGIYQHWKGKYYRVDNILYHHETGEAFVSYFRCDVNGIYQSIRRTENGKEIITNQPFLRSLKEFIEVVEWCDEFIPRFKFIKKV